MWKKCKICKIHELWLGLSDGEKGSESYIIHLWNQHGIQLREFTKEGTYPSFFHTIDWKLVEELKDKHKNTGKSGMFKK